MAAKRLRLLVVGERFNFHKRWRPAVVDPDSLALRLKLGLYNVSWERVAEKLGLPRDCSRMNLLLPSPECGEWDAAEARRVAEKLLPEMEASFDRFALLGGRVARAFGFRNKPFERRGRWLKLPHPSGRCRLWNDDGTSERCRLEVRGLLKYETHLELPVKLGLADGHRRACDSNCAWTRPPTVTDPRDVTCGRCKKTRAFKETKR